MAPSFGLISVTVIGDWLEREAAMPRRRVLLYPESLRRNHYPSSRQQKERRGQVRVFHECPSRRREVNEPAVTFHRLGLALARK